MSEGSDCLEEDELPASYYGNEDDDEFEYDPALEEIAAMHVDKEDVWARSDPEDEEGWIRARSYRRVSC